MELRNKEYKMDIKIKEQKLELKTLIEVEKNEIKILVNHASLGAVHTDVIYSKNKDTNISDKTSTIVKAIKKLISDARNELKVNINNVVVMFSPTELISQEVDFKTTNSINFNLQEHIENKFNNDSSKIAYVDGTIKNSNKFTGILYYVDNASYLKMNDIKKSLNNIVKSVIPSGVTFSDFKDTAVINFSTDKTQLFINKKMHINTLNLEKYNYSNLILKVMNKFSIDFEYAKKLIRNFGAIPPTEQMKKIIIHKDLKNNKLFTKNDLSNIIFENINKIIYKIKKELGKYKLNTNNIIFTNSILNIKGVKQHIEDLGFQVKDHGKLNNYSLLLSYINKINGNSKNWYNILNIKIKNDFNEFDTNTKITLLNNVYENKIENSF